MIGLRQGLQNARGARMPRTEFRTSMTSPEGLGRTDIFQGRVVDVDTVNWTVDVISQFDQMRLLQIPVATPYLHPSRGEGIYFMPEVGAKCSVCWPGDSSPPFLMSFVMPHEVVDAATEEAPAGTQPKGNVNQAPVNASYAGGRPRAKPGDIILRGRDGNFVVLHRGGVLQIGATELAQRIFIPLNNLVMDFAENYAMHTAGGSVTWGLQDGVGNDNIPSQFVQTFRVFANDKYADVRIAAGKVHQPVGETQVQSDLTSLEIGKEQIVYDLTLAKNGFGAEDGSPISGVNNLVKLRFFFDRAGGAFLRMDGNALIYCRKKLRIRVEEDLEVFSKNMFVNVKQDVKLTAGGVFELTGAVLKLNGGEKPMARVGDAVVVALPPGLLMGPPGAPVPVPPPLLAAAGTILGPGNSTILG